MSERRPLIMVVEDDSLMAQVTAALLEEQGYHTLTAYTAAEAREMVKTNNPDLFVLDVMLPDGNGFDLCKEFREQTDEPVLFLTGKKETEDKVEGLSTGGDYYLTKPYEKDEFLAVVGSMLRRRMQTKKKIAEASVIKRGPLLLNIHDGKAFVNGRDAELTHKEFAVLLLLMENEDKELSYDAIYESIWLSPMYGDSGAVRQQISRIKKKLDEEDTDDFSILNASGKGYMFTTN
jgi:DNA-binding response OmpR family regulator